MLMMSYRQLVASERGLAASEKKELAATEALEQAKDARRVAQETVGELTDARRKLVDLAKVTGKTMLTELMAGNFFGGTTLRVRLSLCDQIIGSLKEIGLSEAEIADAKEMWSKGIGVIYHNAIRCALEGRTNPNEINMEASPELRRASHEFGEMVDFPKWQVPSPDQMQSFIDKRGFMNEQVKELIDDYRYFLKTGAIKRREVLELLRDQEQ
jgi:hypothetical protein